METSDVHENRSDLEVNVVPHSGVKELSEGENDATGPKTKGSSGDEQINNDTSNSISADVPPGAKETGNG